MTSGVPPTSGLLSSRTRVWLARGLGLALIALFVALNTLDVAAVKSASDGQRTVYSGSPLLSIFLGCFAVLVFVVGIFAWTHPSRLGKVVGMILFPMSLLLVAFAPTGLNHCVIVTADGFCDRVGFWLFPRETTVDFSNLHYIDLKETDSQRNDRRRYLLRCYPKVGKDVIAIPLDDNLTKALPEIFRNAAKRDVIIAQDNQAFEDLFGESK